MLTNAAPIRTAESWWGRRAGTGNEAQNEYDNRLQSKDAKREEFEPAPAEGYGLEMDRL